MPDQLRFDGCDSETVFRNVTAKAQSPEARTLWGRMLTELRRNGVDGSISFLEGEFSQLEADLTAELQRLKSEG